jgi:hypothetical protein
VPLVSPGRVCSCSKDGNVKSVSDLRLGLCSSVLESLLSAIDFAVEARDRRADVLGLVVVEVLFRGPRGLPLGHPRRGLAAGASVDCCGSIEAAGSSIVSCVGSVGCAADCSDVLRSSSGGVCVCCGARTLGGSDTNAAGNVWVSAL